MGAYSQSKLANLMFTYELQRRLSAGGTTIAVAAHPGLAGTELGRNLPAIVAFSYARVSQKAAMGALPTLRAATDPGVLGGQYYGPRGFFGTRGYPELAALQPAIPRHRHPAPPVDSLRRADRGHIPGLTRPAAPGRKTTGHPRSSSAAGRATLARRAAAADTLL